MKVIKVGLAGLGTVGRGVYEILQKDQETISKKLKNQIKLVAVSARSKKDFVDETKVKFYANALDLANDPEIDVVIEVIGGVEFAKTLCQETIKKGKKLITANKALISRNGFELAKLAEENNTQIAYEAAVAGAIPIVKMFKEGFSANVIESFAAILNGSCNFILTKMQQENLTFLEAQKQAQDLGYLEADPSADIKGYDTLDKLAILSAIASFSKPNLKDSHLEGIENIDIEDINLAFELGYKIKLLAIYKNCADKIEQAVYPALLKVSEKLSQVDDSFNAILTKTSNANWSFVVGRGAGKLETASAVLADLIDMANERYSPLFATESKNLTESKIKNILDRSGKYFLKLVVNKELAKNTDLSKKIFGEKIKIEKALFLDSESEITCGFVTENIVEANLLEALKDLDQNLVKSTKFLRIETYQ